MACWLVATALAKLAVGVALAVYCFFHQLMAEKLPRRSVHWLIVAAFSSRGANTVLVAGS